VVCSRWRHGQERRQDRDRDDGEASADHAGPPERMDRIGCW
jgi:hypothetical protein